MKFSAVAEQGFPAIGDPFRTAHVAIARSCSPAVRHRHARGAVSHASTPTSRASMRFARACIDASTLSLTRRASDARHAICGTCMHAVDHRNRIDFARCASTVFEMRVSSVVDTLNTSTRMCRAHRLRAYRRVEREKFARVVASTHRFFRHASRCSHVGAHDDTECARGACVCSRCTRAQHRVLL